MKGKNQRKKQHRERVIQYQSDREILTEWLYGQMKAATFFQQDASKALALVGKRLGRRITLWEEVSLMDNFRKIEQGNIPEELKHARYAGKGDSAKRKRK